MKTIDAEKIIIATVHPWNIANARKLQVQRPGVVLVTDRKKLTPGFVRRQNPRYIFFPHWSWYIQPEIFEHYECILFHMTDVPYGRGGSPLQNLIVRGHRSTKISAIKVVHAIDAGPVYLKRPLELQGNAEEIYTRCSKIIFEEMIPRILEDKLIPKAQKGKVTAFKRLKPDLSCFNNFNDVKKIYDHIRMLDAPGYPIAFLEFKNMTVHFSQARRVAGGKIVAKAEIKCKR